MGVEFEGDLKEAANKLIKLGDKIELSLDVKIDNAMQGFKEEIQTKFFSGQHGDRDLNSKSGRAKNSWKIRKIKAGDRIDCELYSNVPYIETHETRSRRLNLRGWWALEPRAKIDKLISEALKRI